MITAIFISGRFVAIHYVPIIYTVAHLPAFAAVVLFTLGFFISGCLTVEHRWKHLGLVALVCWLGWVVAAAFGFGNLEIELLLGPFCIALVMGLGGGASAIVRRAPKSTPVSLKPTDIRSHGYYIGTLRKYAVFHGRASRAEYWWFFLVNVLLVPFSLAMIEGAFESMLHKPILPEGSMLADLYSIATLIPLVAVGVRRMHDTDNNGWWIFVPIFNLVHAVTKGNSGGNSYGPMPLA